MRDVHKEWRDLMRYVIENPEMNDLIWFKARPEGFAALTPEESLHVVQHGDIFLNYWQETYRLHKSGRLDTAHFHRRSEKTLQPSGCQGRAGNSPGLAARFNGGLSKTRS